MMRDSDDPRFGPQGQAAGDDAQALGAGGRPGSVVLDDLAANPGFLLRLAWMIAQDEMEQQPAAVRLSAAEYAVLRTIGQTPGIRQGLLAEVLHIKPAGMTRLLQGFEDRGLVIRRTPEDDRRTVVLGLLPEGRAALRAGDAAYDGTLTEGRAPLSPREMAQLLRLLRKFCGIGEDGLLRPGPRAPADPGRG